jgi:hypothetical protein
MLHAVRASAAALHLIPISHCLHARLFHFLDTRDERISNTHSGENINGSGRSGGMFGRMPHVLAAHLSYGERARLMWGRSTGAIISAVIDWLALLITKQTPSELSFFWQNINRAPCARKATRGVALKCLWSRRDKIVDWCSLSISRQNVHGDAARTRTNPLIVLLFQMHRWQSQMKYDRKKVAKSFDTHETWNHDPKLFYSLFKIGLSKVVYFHTALL